MKMFWCRRFRRTIPGKRRLFRRSLLWKVSVIVLFIVVLYLFLHGRTLARDLEFYVKPIWGSPHRKSPERLISHFYAEHIPIANLCSYHGWKARSPENIPKVIDAITFSNELDILEIRLKELWNVVDIFVVVEADRTFTGAKKRLYFQENKRRFKWAAGKLKHFVLTTLSPHPSPSNHFENEAKMRNYVTQVIKETVAPNGGDLVLATDCDEVPFPRVIDLLRTCEGYPKELHLQFQEYLYSFEFKLFTKNWRPHVTIYNNNSFEFHHIIKQDSQELLADSGWHCSFCFRHISDFIFKMTAYSHSNYITERRHIDPEDIQRRICEGINIFELPPEAYSFKDFITRMDPTPKQASTIGIPEYVVSQPTKFRFLLPGGCVRQDYSIDITQPHSGE